MIDPGTRGCSDPARLSPKVRRPTHRPGESVQDQRRRPEGRRVPAADTQLVPSAEGDAGWLDQASPPARVPRFDGLRPPVTSGRPTVHPRPACRWVVWLAAMLSALVVLAGAALAWSLSPRFSGAEWLRAPLLSPTAAARAPAPVATSATPLARPTATVAPPKMAPTSQPPPALPTQPAPVPDTSLAGLVPCQP